MSYGQMRRRGGGSDSRIHVRGRNVTSSRNDDVSVTETREELGSVQRNVMKYVEGEMKRSKKKEVEINEEEVLRKKEAQLKKQFRELEERKQQLFLQACRERLEEKVRRKIEKYKEEVEHEMKTHLSSISHRRMKQQREIEMFGEEIDKKLKTLSELRDLLDDKCRHLTKEYELSEEEVRKEWKKKIGKEEGRLQHALEKKMKQIEESCHKT